MQNNSTGWFQWPFAACAALLLTTAVGLDPILARLSAHYRKTSIQPRKPLAGLTADALPSFNTAPEGSPFIDYQSDDTVGTDDILLLRLQESSATGLDGQVILLVTYYSDPEDRVPHTPEVCYRQIGGIVRSIASTEIPLSRPDDLTSTDLPNSVSARTLVIEEPGVNAVIAYLFCANGRFMTTRNAVRLALGLPGDKRVYFCKIEAVTASPPDADPATALTRCKNVLSESLPRLLGEYFPTRADLKKR